MRVPILAVIVMLVVIGSPVSAVKREQSHHTLRFEVSCPEYWDAFYWFETDWFDYDGGFVGVGEGNKTIRVEGMLFIAGEVHVYQPFIGNGSVWISLQVYCNNDLIENTTGFELVWVNIDIHFQDDPTWDPPCGGGVGLDPLWFWNMLAQILFWAFICAVICVILLACERWARPTSPHYARAKYEESLNDGGGEK